MLVLTRYINEKIVINNNIIVTIKEINGNQVRLGIEAPKNIPVYREEVQVKIKLAEKLLETRK